MNKDYREYEVSRTKKLEGILPDTASTYFLLNVLRLVEGEEDLEEETMTWLRQKEVDTNSISWRSYIEKVMARKLHR